MKLQMNDNYFRLISKADIADIMNLSNRKSLGSMTKEELHNELFGKYTKITDLDIVYISYDETKADDFFEDLKNKSPRTPLRVHGVKGFDAAYKAAANLVTTDHFITIDGDNIVREEFFNSELHINPKYVYSFSALNSINGLAYGNGGIKIWPKNLVLSNNTHENGQGNDFCWLYPYWQIDDIMSDIHYCDEYSAFRAGFREAVKLSLVSNKKLDTWEETLEKIYPPNLSRLLIWASIGRDVEYGQWAIYGAINGLYNLWIKNIDADLINDYDWLREKYTDYKPSLIQNMSLRNIGINIEIVDELRSKWFKKLYINVERNGPMIPEENIYEN